MIKFEAADGSRHQLPHPDKTARALRRSLTLEEAYPPLALAAALAAHLEGKLRIKPGPELAASYADGMLHLSVPGELPAELKAVKITEAAGVVLVYSVKDVFDATPEPEYGAAWARRFAREFLR